MKLVQHRCAPIMKKSTASLSKSGMLASSGLHCGSRPASHGSLTSQHDREEVAHAWSSPHKCSSPSCPARPAQATLNLPRNSPFLLGTRDQMTSPEQASLLSPAAVSQLFAMRLSVWPHMESALGPTTVSHHPADLWAICKYMPPTFISVPCLVGRSVQLHSRFKSNRGGRYRTFGSSSGTRQCPSSKL